MNKQETKRAEIELKRLRIRSRIVLGEITKVLKRDFNRTFGFNIRPIDRNRLFNLQIWSDKYKVSIRWILHVLVPYWSKKLKRKPGQAWGLGVKVQSFVGKHSQRIIEEEIIKQFPERENEKLWNHAKRMELTGLAERSPVKYRDVLECESIDDFVRKYRKRVAVRRRELDTAESQPSKRHRLYRNNPWL